VTDRARTRTQLSRETTPLHPISPVTGSDGVLFRPSSSTTRAPRLNTSQYVGRDSRSRAITSGMTMLRTTNRASISGNRADAAIEYIISSSVPPPSARMTALCCSRQCNRSSTLAHAARPARLRRAVLQLRRRQPHGRQSRDRACVMPRRKLMFSAYHWVDLRHTTEASCLDEESNCVAALNSTNTVARNPLRCLHSFQM
jgi:hypothetical protein